MIDGPAYHGNGTKQQLIDIQISTNKGGSAYNEKLIPVARGYVLPDRRVPAGWILYDLWESLRARDRVLADGILEPTFAFMRAQTDKSRLTIRNMGPISHIVKMMLAKREFC